MAQLVKQLTLKHEVGSSNPSWCNFVFETHIVCTFCRYTFWTHRNGTWTKLNAHHLGTRKCWLLMDICFGLSFTAHWRHWCREQPSLAVVYSCQNCTDKQWLTSSAVDSIPELFFQFLDLYEAGFFLYSGGTCFGLLLWHVHHYLAQLVLFASHQYWHVTGCMLVIKLKGARVSHDGFIYHYPKLRQSCVYVDTPVK